MCDVPHTLEWGDHANTSGGHQSDEVATRFAMFGWPRMRSHHRSRFTPGLRTSVALCLGFVVSLGDALAQDKPILGAQSSGINVNNVFLQTWRTITFGTHKGVDAYRGALASAGVKIGDSADEILGRPEFPYASMKTDVELGLLSAAQLGVETDQSSLSDLYKRARQAGLGLCPAEVGLQLRLDYHNQPLGEALNIAMEPVATYSGDPTVLALVNFGSGLALVGSSGRSEFMVARTSRFVFAVPTNRPLEALRGPQIVPDVFRTESARR